jgi:phenylacetate-CoA ligase
MNGLYERLPVFGQNLACSWAGYRRARARFTPHFHSTLETWQRSINGPVEALWSLQRERLSRLVDRAAEFVPYYRALGMPKASAASDPRQAIAETLASIPPLEKEAYRDRPEDFVAVDLDASRLHRGSTSGTTGTALPLFYTQETLAEEYATVWRLRMARGVRLADAHLTFGGQIIVPFSRSAPPFWRSNLYGRQTLFSLYHMTPSNLEKYVHAIHKTRAHYVMGYPSALHLVARTMLDMGMPLPPGRLKAVFTSSESLLAYQRSAIEEAFAARVWDRYGTSEFAVSMTACAAGNLHVDMEFCIVEVEAQEETDQYVRGPLLVTGLAGHATPFIRYRIGDVGTRLKQGCSCGRPGDVFSDIDGRNEDFVVTPDGRAVGRLDHIFKSQRSVLEAQILQDSKEAIEVLFVPAAGFDERDEAHLRAEIRARLGAEIHVDLTPVSLIRRERNGKFRAVKSRIGHSLRVSSPGQG